MPANTLIAVRCSVAIKAPPRECEFMINLFGDLSHNLHYS